MEYKFLEEFPVVRYLAEGDIPLTLWIFRYPEHEENNNNQGEEINCYLNNLELLGMVYPEAVKILNSAEELYLSKKLFSGDVMYSDTDYYWIDENGGWG